MADNDEIRDQVDLTKKALEATKNIASQNKEINKQQKEIVDVTKEYLQLLNDSEGTMVDITRVQEVQNKLTLVKSKLEEITDGRLQSQKDKMADIVQLIQDSVTATEAVHDAQKATLDVSKEYAKTITDDIIGAIPGGAILDKMFGGKLSEALISSITDHIHDASLSAEEMEKKTEGIMKKWVAAGAAIGAVTMLFNAAFDALQQLTSEQRAFQDNIGLSADQALRLSRDTRDTVHNMTQFGVTLQDVTTAASVIAEQFDKIPKASGELVTNTLMLNRLLGVSVSDAAAVQRSFMEMGASSSEAFQTIALAKNLADAAGVPLPAITKDIAQNAGVAATYFKGSKEELIKSAVYAKQLGLSLSDVGKISDKILDIQGSLASEMQASVMLGQNFNFDRARLLALEGNMKAATEDVVQQIAKGRDFNKLNMLEKQSLVELTGLEADQLQKVTERQRIINNMTATQKAQLQAAEASLDNQNKLTADRVIQEAQSAMRQQEMNATMESLKLSLQEALIPLAEGMLPIMQGLSSIAGGIGSFFKEYPALIGAAAGALTVVAGALAVAAIAASGLTLGAATIAMAAGAAVIGGYMTGMGVGSVPSVSTGAAATNRIAGIEAANSQQRIEVVNHNTLHMDGKQIATNTTKHQNKYNDGSKVGTGR